MSNELNKLTKSQIIALIESGAFKPVKAKREKLAYRITNADKSCVVGTPLKESRPEYAKGKTFAVWLDTVQGESVKRRAYDGVTFLVVDTRAIAKADVLEIAHKWGNGKKLNHEVIELCHVFTKAGK